MTLTREDSKIFKIMLVEKNKTANKMNYRRRQRILKEAANGCWWVEAYFKISEGRS